MGPTPVKRGKQPPSKSIAGTPSTTSAAATTSKQETSPLPPPTATPTADNSASAKPKKSTESDRGKAKDKTSKKKKEAATPSITPKPLSSSTAPSAPSSNEWIDAVVSEIAAARASAAASISVEQVNLVNDDGNGSVSDISGLLQRSHISSGEIDVASNVTIADASVTSSNESPSIASRSGNGLVSTGKSILCYSNRTRGGMRILRFLGLIRGN